MEFAHLGLASFSTAYTRKVLAEERLCPLFVRSLFNISICPHPLQPAFVNLHDCSDFFRTWRLCRLSLRLRCPSLRLRLDDNFKLVDDNRHGCYSLLVIADGET